MQKKTGNKNLFIPKTIVENTLRYVKNWGKELTNSQLGNKLLKIWADAVKLFHNLHKMQNVAQANFELGEKHYNLKNFDDAVLRFKFVTWLEPKYALAWYWLGASYIAAGKKPAGIKSLKKALQIKPDWQEANDALAAASQK
jgi:tetratricopeptide (TPR) repeat protein